MDRLLRYLLAMAWGAAPSLALFCCALPWRRRKLAQARLRSAACREAAMALLWMFCGGMAVLALTPYWVASSLVDILHGFPWNVGGYPFFRLGGVNLIPFQTFQSDSWSLFNLAGNIVMFLPFGFFAALLWRGYTWRRSLGAGLCITAFIECWQLCVGRAFDIDDMILNTLGVFCGYLIWALLRSCAPGFAEKFHVNGENP